MTLDLSSDPIPRPGQQLRNVPATLLLQPAVSILTYPVEGIMAGKVEGMLRRCPLNTRFKDYYDLYRLAQTQDFVAATLDLALRDVCAHHQTSLAPNSVFLDPAFPTDPVQLSGWQRFVNATYLPGGMPSFADVMDLTRCLYVPLLQGTVGGLQWDHLQGRWR